MQEIFSNPYLSWSSRGVWNCWWFFPFLNFYLTFYIEFHPCPLLFPLSGPFQNDLSSHNQDSKYSEFTHWFHPAQISLLCGDPVCILIKKVESEFHLKILLIPDPVTMLSSCLAIRKLFDLNFSLFTYIRGTDHITGVYLCRSLGNKWNNACRSTQSTFNMLAAIDIIRGFSIQSYPGQLKIHILKRATQPPYVPLLLW